jgi:uncharacterized protein
MKDDARDLRSPPVPDQDSAPYWDALNRHEIVMQHCQSCGAYRCPPLPACHICGSIRFGWEQAGNDGVVYSWITVRHPVGTLDAGELPATFATVDFGHGCRLVTRYFGSTPVRIGAPVCADFLSHGEWTELVVRPTEDEP